MNLDPSLDPFITAAATRRSVPDTMIRAVIIRESGGDPKAVGDHGLARGLMQMHETACATIGADFEEMFDPEKAIDAGAAYLRWIYERLGTWEWALGAYNQGPTIVMRAKRYADAVLDIEEQL